jgi:hypothetical protein
MFGSATEDISAPTVGGEWLITRTRVAMYVSVEQSFFNTQGAVFDGTSAGSERMVDIQDSRRYNMQLFAFPKQYGAFRPYAGLGFSLISIRDVAPEGTFVSAASQDTVLRSINASSSRTTPVFTSAASSTSSEPRCSFRIGHGDAEPLLINGKPTTYLIEAGLRYNLTDAIEKLH